MIDFSRVHTGKDNGKYNNKNATEVKFLEKKFKK